MFVTLTHTLDGLERDMKAMPKRLTTGTAKIVRDRAKQGNKVAKAYAKESAGAHGKHYHKAFSAERIQIFEWEYGPDDSKPQGDMSFEYGSRNQAPHFDLAKSAQLVGPLMVDDVRDLLDRLFW